MTVNTILLLSYPGLSPCLAEIALHVIVTLLIHLLQQVHDTGGRVLGGRSGAGFTDLSFPTRHTEGIESTTEEWRVQLRGEEPAKKI